MTRKLRIMKYRMWGDGLTGEDLRNIFALIGYGVVLYLGFRFIVWLLWLVAYTFELGIYA